MRETVQTALVGAVVLVLAMGAAPVRAQDDGAAAASDASEQGCQYHVDCPTDHVCRRGACVETDRAFEEFSADEACGADRRCRIERLERRNRARRHARKLDEERHLEEMLDEREQKEIEEIPRLDRPFSFDIRISRMGVLGLAAGYTFENRLRPELQYVHWNAWVTVDHEDQHYGGNQQMNFVMPGLFYFFLESEITPYGAAKFVYGRGSFDSGATRTVPGSDGGSEEQEIGRVDTIYHALEFEAGVDAQLTPFGAHTRLGLAYRPLIYNQARIEAGQYADQTRGALEQWFGEMMRIDVIFMVGWAF